MDGAQPANVVVAVFDHLVDLAALHGVPNHRAVEAVLSFDAQCSAEAIKADPAAARAALVAWGL